MNSADSAITHFPVVFHLNFTRCKNVLTHKIAIIYALWLCDVDDVKTVMYCTNLWNPTFVSDVCTTWYNTVRYGTLRYVAVRFNEVRYEILRCPHREICLGLKCCAHVAEKLNNLAQRLETGGSTHTSFCPCCKGKSIVVVLFTYITSLKTSICFFTKKVRVCVFISEFWIRWLGGLLKKLVVAILDARIKIKASI